MSDERQGMRGHSDGGNVRPADTRFNLHKPEDESDVVRSPAAEDKAPDQSGASARAQAGRGSKRSTR